MSRSPVAVESKFDLDSLKANLLKLVLRVSAFLGLLVYLPSVVLGFKQGMLGLVAVDTIAIVAVFALLLFDRISFGVRASAVCLIFYALGVVLLISVGSISQIYLFGFSVVTVLLLGVRVGLGAALLSAVSLFAVGALGRAAPEMAVPNWSQNLVGWLVITINFALVNTLLTLAVGTILAAVSKALTREIATGAALDRERTLLRTLIDTLPDVVFTKDAQGAFLNCNPATLALFGLEREEQLAGKTVFDFYAPELAGTYHADDLDVMAGRTLLNREERSVDAAGKALWYLTIKVPLRDAAGETVGLLGISRDITDRKAAEAERDRVLARLQLQVERMPLAYLLSDRDFGYTHWNPAAERIFGFAQAEILGQQPFDTIVPAESRPFVASIFDRIKAGSMDAHGESENRTKDGTTITCEWHNTPMFDERGAFAGVLSLAQDVTARKRLEEQLRQAQKMEAIGQLAGGVAHDFNNLLSVVLSYSHLAIHALRTDDPIRGDLEEILRAGERAAGLTRQLLMFSRQQVVEPQVLDVNDVMLGVDKMLRRMVGEDVALAAVPGAALGHVRADRGSLEQVIMNLTINARDAMPTGGKITMETANVALDREYATTHLGVTPGPYVMFSVTDTGAGMDKPTLARIFEPFFTTKEQGKGTGLGLSTVFGIVQRSGGSIWVYSELGIGTTFKVYLPRIDEAKQELLAPAVPTTVRGSETILLVEDDQQVRDLARGILVRHGYTVIDAGNAGEAFLVCEEHEGRIHLLLSDVVMPKMSGPVLARRLMQARPEMKVICMSGYTDDAAVRHGVLDAEFAYLQKPLTVDTLTRKVRNVLDSS